MGKAKGIAFAIIALIVIGVITAASVQIVDAGYRGVLLHWSAVDTSVPPLEEGLHFVVPFQDTVVNTEVRTLKIIKSTSSASKDLQTVSTEVTVNYRPSPNSVNILYKEVGPDYENRIIQPAIEEVVKQVTAKYNAESLITQRPLVKSDIEGEIITRLNEFNIITDAVSITDFQFSPLFAQAIESKVEAEQKEIKETKEESKLSNEEWRKYFTGHWNFAGCKQDKHIAMFPEKLITPMILSGSPKDGIVLDPFMGAGTTAKVAQEFGRHYLGIELNPEYIKLAEKRLIQRILT